MIDENGCDRELAAAHDWPLAVAGSVTCRRCGWRATLDDIANTPMWCPPAASEGLTQS